MPEERDKPMPELATTGIGGISDNLCMVSLVVTFGLWGCLTVYNSSIYGQHPLHFALRQLLWLAAGATILVAASLPSFSFYQRNHIKLALLFWYPLLLVLLIGAKINGMRGWFDFDLFFLQPSELAKPVFVLSMCQIAGLHDREPRRFLTMLAVCAIWVLPIAFEPDYGTVLIYVAGFLTIYWARGGRPLYLLTAALSSVSAAVWVVNQHPYILRRVASTIFPELDPTGAGMARHATTADNRPRRLMG